MTEPPIIDQLNYSPSLTPPTTPDPTTDWNTYIIQNPGISLKYPPNWGINNVPEKSGNLYQSSLQLIDPSSGNQTTIPTIVVSIYENPKKLSPQEFEQSYKSQYPDSPHLPFYSPSAILKKIGALDSQYFTYEACDPGTCEVYVTTLNESIIQIETRTDFVDKSIINQILSTVKFTK